MPARSADVLEFVSGEYFLPGHRPDLIVFFASAHEHRPLARYSIELDRLADSIERLLGRSSRGAARLVFVPLVAEHAKMKPEPWRSMTYENGTKTRNEYLKAANRIWFRKMRKRFIDSGGVGEEEAGGWIGTKKQPGGNTTGATRDRLLMFPDIFEMSRDVLDYWNWDGVHMRPAWYQHVLSFIFQSLCSTQV